MSRLTTDNPKTNTETLLNYAFDKENKIYLRESEEGLELCEYVAGLCSGHAGGVSEEDIMDGACMDCRGCSAGALYFCAVQAAELRARLKAYEDTELTPEEVETLHTLTKSYPSILGAAYKLKDYEQAEAEGRLIVLPCKVGDTVWFDTWERGIKNIGIQPHKIDRVDVTFVSEVSEFVRTEIPLRELGKSVFLTREAAEAALKEAQG